MSEPPPNATPSSTEDVPAAPGWVEPAVDEILSDPGSGLRQGAALAALRRAYLDCLAGAGRGEDIDEAHDRCRRALLAGLAGLQDGPFGEIEQRLEALEAELSARI